MSNYFGFIDIKMLQYLNYFQLILSIRVCDRDVEFIVEETPPFRSWNGMTHSIVEERETWEWARKVENKNVKIIYIIKNRYNTS